MKQYFLEALHTNIYSSFVTPDLNIDTQLNIVSVHTMDNKNISHNSAKYIFNEVFLGGRDNSNHIAINPFRMSLRNDQVVSSGNCYRDQTEHLSTQFHQKQVILATFPKGHPRPKGYIDYYRCVQNHW